MPGIYSPEALGRDDGGGERGEFSGWRDRMNFRSRYKDVLCKRERSIACSFSRAEMGERRFLFCSSWVFLANMLI